MRPAIWIAIALGGAVGSLARQAVNLALASTVARPVPYATALVNLAGAALIGWLAGSVASGRMVLTAPVQAFVFVGLLGGFTTFSSFVLDTLLVAQSGGRALAVGNLVGQTLCGMALVWAAYALAVRA